MARKALETENEQHIVTEDDAQGLPAMLAETQQLTIAQAAVMESFDVVKAIGQIESAVFLRQVVDKLVAEIAINVREGKKYKGLTYKDAEGNIRQVVDFAEFCQVFLGKSYTRTIELIKNYNMLGPELYEQAERIGFRQRDYNALKALPADDRLLIGQAIEAEDLDKALDLMQTMAARHFHEKEQAEKLIAEKDLSLEAKDRVISDKTAELNKKSERIAVLEAVKKNEVQEEYMPGHVQLTALQDYTRRITSEIEASLRSHVVKLLNEFESGFTPKYVELAIGQSLGLIITAAHGVAEDLHIDPILDAETAAVNPAKADAEAFLAHQAAQTGQQNTDLMDDSGDLDPEEESFDDFFEETPELARNKKKAKDKQKPLMEYTDEDWARLKNTEA